MSENNVVRPAESTALWDRFTLSVTIAWVIVAALLMWVPAARESQLDPDGWTTLEVLGPVAWGMTAMLTWASAHLFRSALSVQRPELVIGTSGCLFTPGDTQYIVYLAFDKDIRQDAVLRPYANKLAVLTLATLGILLGRAVIAGYLNAHA